MNAAEMPTLLYVTLALIPIGLGFAAQFWMRRTFAHAAAIPSALGLRAAEAAGRLLGGSGCAGVRVETVEGELTDHYDPRARVIRLSEAVASSSSLGALAVAGHEVGHAAQDQSRDRAFRLQRFFGPVAAFCSYGWLVAIGAGLVLESAGLLGLAVLLFGAVAAFHVAMLPVELDASRRALSLLEAQGILVTAELPTAHKVLRAAALTYLVAALTAITELLRIALEIALAGDDE